MLNLAPDCTAKSGDRDVHGFLGLAVDHLTLASTNKTLRDKASQPGTAVLSTINVNWVVQSFSDAQFRAAILNSEIVTLDGKPLLWLARGLGLPMKETVPGSTLMQEMLNETTEKPMSIFLFGGEAHTAELAMEKINELRGGLRAVGALNPGFGSVEELSTPAIIETINQTQPDLLLVALGAKKGTQWIEHNRHRLNTKIISHLGATINFLAGTVKRAPRTFQIVGFEWLWRILQEPKLFSRYAKDGCALGGVIVRFLPLWLYYYRIKKHFKNQPIDTIVERTENDTQIIYKFGKNLHTAPRHNPSIHLANTVTKKVVTLDFLATEFAGSAFFGQLLLFLHQQPNPVQCRCNSRFMKLLVLFGVNQQLNIQGAPH